MHIRFHLHALERLAERGATEPEARLAITSGIRSPAKFGRISFQKEFRGTWEWLGLSYTVKQITVICVEESGILVITAIVKFYNYVFEMKLTIDPRYNVAYLRLKEKSGQCRTISVSDSINIDISPDGSVAGIELLDACNQIVNADNGKLIFVDESSGKQAEFSLNG